MYLDASSDAPITFIVNAKNELSPGVKLSNEIIVNVKASYSYVRPAYFDKSKYNFDIQEKDLVIHLLIYYSQNISTFKNVLLII